LGTNRIEEVGIDFHEDHAELGVDELEVPSAVAKPHSVEHGEDAGADGAMGME
jgi:hypothetical protein